jgi:hypothetical protein
MVKRFFIVMEVEGASTSSQIPTIDPVLRNFISDYIFTNSFSKINFNTFFSDVDLSKGLFP